VAENHGDSVSESVMHWCFTVLVTAQIMVSTCVDCLAAFATQWGSKDGESKFSFEHYDEDSWWDSVSCWCSWK